MKEKTKFLKGFTLVEILVSALILSFIIAGIFAILNVANISWYTDMGLLGLQQQARQAMYKMVREIRQSSQSTPSAPLTIDDGKITFYIPPEVYADADGNLNPWAGPISYYRDVNDTNNDGVVNQIIREYPQGTRKIVANDITALNFSINKDIISGNYLVEISLAAKRTVGTRQLCFPAPCQSPAKTLKETIMLRN